MAQLTYNTMRFGTDNFNIIEARQTALLISKNPLVETLEWNKLVQFDIKGEFPQGSEVRFAFTSDVENFEGKIFTLSNNGADRIARDAMRNPDSTSTFSSDYTVEDITADAVLTYGNTIADLQSLAGLELASGHLEVKQRMRPIIAIAGTADAIPKVQFGMYVAVPKITTDHERIRTSEFDNPVKIVDLEGPEVTVTGNAAATVTAAYKSSADGDYSDFGDPKDLVGKTIYGAKFKRILHVDSPDGTNKVHYTGFRAKLTEDVECPVFGDFADIHSIVKNYYIPLKYCVVVVKHNELSGGAKIRASVKIDPIMSAFNQQIGTGTGSSQTITLPTKKFADISTLKVYVNGTQTTKYDFNVADNTISITAPNGATISAFYNYNLQLEDWVTLTADTTQRDISDGKFTTRYSYKITDSNIYVSAIRLRLFRGSEGEEKSVTLPITPSGEAQSYRLAYNADISLTNFLVKNSSGAIVYGLAASPAWSYHSDFDYDAVSVSFNSKTSTINFTVPKGDYTLEAYYRQNAVTPKVYSWTAGWCV